MSERERRNFDDSFKAKVALEAVREEKTISELAGIYKIHANLIRKWKREFEAGASKVFSASKDENKELKQLRSEKEHLEQLIGQQTITINWFKKKAERFNLL